MGSEEKKAYVSRKGGKPKSRCICHTNVFNDI